MAERHVVFALRRKYAELKGVLKFDPTADPYATVKAINEVGCVLRMFSPTEDLTAIRPRRPYRPQRHTWARTALDILRREGRPMTARSLARCVLEAEGAEPTPAVLMSVECSLHAVLGRLEGRGVVREGGTPKRWRVL
jgi:hypothetical protein